LHPRAIDEALCDDISLLITCDTGIGEAEVVERGVASGLTIIITDHHDLPPRLPPAQALVDPNMLPADHALRELSGVGVAYMVARALLEGAGHASLLEEMLDLVALGLVADVARQVKDVRYLIQRGLVALRRTRRPGLEALVRAAGLELAHLNELDISFQLGPRLNAAGRLADSELALRLLLTHDVDEAQRLAGKLEALNRDRQARTEAVVMEIEDHLRRDPELARKPAIILDGEGWEIGVLGLVATDLARRHDRPAILIAHREGGPSAASARSVEGVDIHEAILSQREHLLREGGHPMAAGFSIERGNVPVFRRGLWHWMLHEAPPRKAALGLPVDAEVPWEEVDLPLAHEIARLAPFGAGNPRPTLMTGSGTLIRAEDLSRTRETAHRRLFLDDDSGRPLRLIWFDAGEMPAVGERLDVAFNLSTTYWRGEEHLQLELVDWRPTASKLGEALSELVAGREVVDWRSAGAAEQLLARLRADYGERLLVWAEGLPNRVEGPCVRHELVGRRAAILAVLTPPAGPEELRWVLAEVQPQMLYLLPPRDVAEPAPAEFLGQVAGMLRLALREHGGHIDTLRMAARVGARQAAVVAALRGLEALDKVSLRHEAGQLRAYLSQEAPPEPELSAGGSAEGEAEYLTNRQSAKEQARSALLYLLRETRAYRRAYRTLPLAALLHGEK
jgi:single-stranded-DNA-specific exonuclease